MTELAQDGGGNGGCRMLAVIAGLGLWLGMPAAASAQQLVYKFTDPSFGGNPFNGSALMNVANAQNGYKDPNAQSSLSAAQIFSNQLQSRLLSALSDQIVTAIFGANPQQSGTIKFGGQTITFSRGLTDVTLNISDDVTKQVTQIIVPTTITVN